MKYNKKDNLTDLIEILLTNPEILNQENPEQTVKLPNGKIVKLSADTVKTIKEKIVELITIRENNIVKLLLSKEFKQVLKEAILEVLQEDKELKEKVKKIVKTKRGI